MLVLKISETTDSTGLAFRLDCGDGCIRTASVKQGYKTRNDGILWAMLEPVMLCSSYSQEQQHEQARLSFGSILEHGDLVFIGEQLCRCKVYGQCSDAAVFEPVPDTRTMSEVSDLFREHIGNYSAFSSFDNGTLVTCYSIAMEQNEPELMSKFLGL